MNARFETRYIIEGMRCEHCIGVVSALFVKLGAEPDPKVELSSGSVSVSWPEPPPDGELLRAQLAAVDFRLTAIEPQTPTRVDQIRGMRCEHCVGVVTRLYEDELGAAAGVTVDLELGTVAARWPDGAPSAQALRERLSAADFELLEHPAASPARDRPESELELPESSLSTAPATASPEGPSAPRAVIYRVEGMTCASCVSRVESALAAVDGVAEAVVNLATRHARLTLRRPVPESTLAAALDEAGYSLLTDDQKRAPEAPADWLAFWLASFGCALIMALDHGPLSRSSSAWLQGGVCALVLATAARPFFRHGLPALWRRRPEMNSLISLGLLAAFGASVLELAFGLAEPRLLFSEAAMLTSFVSFGRALEARARSSAFKALESLLSEEPQTASRLDDTGRPETVATSQLAPGDLISIPRGARVPVDAQVTEGLSHFDESIVTGEPRPLSRGPGDQLVAGALNSEAPVTARVLKTGADSTLRQLAALVGEAQASKAPIQRFADRAASVFVPVVLALSLLTAFAWLAVTGSAMSALSHAVAVLVVACPCALGLATPTAVAVGSAVALKRGLLVKRAPSLEALAKVRTLLFDKTGTLTRGRPTLCAALPEEGADALITALAARSSHPLSRAVITGLDSPQVEAIDEVRERPGLGLTARHQEQPVLLGSEALLREHGATVPEPLARFAAAQRELGSSLVYFARGAVAERVLCFRDPARREAGAVLRALRDRGLKLKLVTGDAEAPARALANALGIDDVVAGVSPEQKLRCVEQARRDAQPGSLTAMIGDGLNDAPALAAADLGLAIGAGSDVARQAGDVVLMGDRLEGIVDAIDIGRATLNKIRQNLLWAVGYNVLALPLAAGALAPWGISLSPAFAGLAMSLSSVSVVLNSLSLRRLEGRLERGLA